MTENVQAERVVRPGADASGKNESAAEVYKPLVEEGASQVERPILDLALSGLIAGLDIGFGPLAVAVVAGLKGFQAAAASDA